MTLFEKNMDIEPTPYEKEMLRRIEAKFPPVRSQQVRGGVFQKVLDASTVSRFYRRYRGKAGKLVIGDPRPGLVETVEKLEAMKDSLSNKTGLGYNFMWRVQACLLYQHADPENAYMGDTLGYVLGSALPEKVDEASSMEWFGRAYDPNGLVRRILFDWGSTDIARMVEEHI